MCDTRGVPRDTEASYPFTFDELPLHTPAGTTFGFVFATRSPPWPQCIRTGYSARYARLTPMPLSPLVCYLLRHVTGGCAPVVRCFVCEGPMLMNVHDSMSMLACQPLL